MSIQSAREQIAKNQGAILSADGNFFRSVANRYENLKAKSNNPHPADLRRLRAEVGQWTSAHLNKRDFNAATDQAAYDGAMGWVDLLGEEIRLHEIGADADSISNRRGNGWADATTGEPIRLLAPTENVAEGHSRTGDVSVGNLIQALMTGTKSPEIKAALSEGTDSAGGYSIPTEVLPEFFDKLRAKTQFLAAGARTLMLNGLRTRIIRVSADPTAAWRAESAAVNESAPTFDAVNFAPQSLAVLVRTSVELLQDSVNVADALERVLIGAMSVALDQAALFGTGTSNQPTGIFNTSGINSVSLGTNGLTPLNYDAICDGVYAMESANAGPATAAIMHPRTANTYRKMKDGMNQPMRLPPAIADLPFLKTTSVPITQTQGTASNASTVLIGDFSQAILGLRQELIITPLNQQYMPNLQIGFIAHLRADIQVAHPESFTKVIGYLP